MGFHRVLALVVLALLLIAVVVGLLALARPAWGQRYPLFLRIVSAAIGIQAVVGIVLLLGGQRPKAGLHFLFGPLVLFTLPVAARIAERRRGRDHGLVLVGGAALAFVIALLALVTGGGGA